ncbi:MAG: 16S rRNA (guanine(527)-N(7))-methyltransferase RsmG [Culicoidibacterales bacterium]
MTVEQFSEAMAKHGINLNETQLAQYERYWELLVEWNEKMNLTGITEKEEVYLKHFYDSLTLAFNIDLTKIETMCDVGSGAGFPGIPLKIAFPHLKLTIVDSLNKRINFLNTVVDELGLINVTPVHARAEEYVQTHRETFDLATARAVARLNMLAELCLPFVKINGLFVAMKGASSSEELLEAAKGLKILGGHLQKEVILQLPEEESHRAIVVVDKIKPTHKKYPRSFGQIKKKPL